MLSAGRTLCVKDCGVSPGRLLQGSLGHASNQQYLVSVKKKQNTKPLNILYANEKKAHLKHSVSPSSPSTFAIQTVLPESSFLTG